MGNNLQTLDLFLFFKRIRAFCDFRTRFFLLSLNLRIHRYNYRQKLIFVLSVLDLLNPDFWNEKITFPRINMKKIILLGLVEWGKFIRILMFATVDGRIGFAFISTSQMWNHPQKVQDRNCFTPKHESNIFLGKSIHVIYTMCSTFKKQKPLLQTWFIYHSFFFLRYLSFKDFSAFCTSHGICTSKLAISFQET